MTDERQIAASPHAPQGSADMFAVISSIDKLMTIKSAADALGLPYHKVQRATARRLIPTYSLGASKKYVRLRDILSRLEGSAP